MNLRMRFVVVAGILLASVELVCANSQKGDEGGEVSGKAVDRTLAASCAHKMSNVPATHTRKVRGVAGKLPTKPSSFQPVNLRQDE